MTIVPISAENLTANKHGFFTRKGGKSMGIYAGLNCGLGSNDDMENVKANREVVAGWFDLDITNMRGMNQIHSDTVYTATAAVPEAIPKCDGIVTADPSVLLSVLTADCAPVLFEDASNRVVGAAHAGWKGALGGVLERTIDAMVKLGASRAHIRAAIGPCISQKAYEVGQEFFETFMAESPDHAQYFAQGSGDRFQFDLPRFALDRLRNAGVSDAQWTGHCTYSDPEKFFSYRRTCHQKEPDYGRLIASIRV